MADPASILIVESDGNVSYMLERVLARDGFDVRVAKTADECLQEMARAPADVLLIESQLSDRSGIELLSELRTLPYHFQAIVMTLDPAVEVKLEAIGEGAFDVVVKPFSNLKLVSHKVETALIAVLALKERDEALRKWNTDQKRLSALQNELEKERTHAQELVGTDAYFGVLTQNAVYEKFRTEASRALRYTRPLSIAIGRFSDAENDGSPPELSKNHLRAIAKISRSSIRDVDSLGLWQDEALLFVFPETPKARGVQATRRILKLIEDASASVSSSESWPRLKFGLAALPSDTMNAEQLLRRAEEALNDEN